MAKGYKSSGRCSTCRAKATDGRSLRRELDDRRAAGASAQDVRDWAITQGFTVSVQNLLRHFNQHSPHLKDKDLLKATAKVLKTELKAIKVTQEIQKQAQEADEILDDVLREGKKRLDDGDIVIDGTMLLKAIDTKMRYGSSQRVEALQGELVDALEGHAPRLLEAEMD